MPGGARKHRSRPVKVKKQKKKYIRSKDPLQAVLMWGVQHSVSRHFSSYIYLIVCVCVCVCVCARARACVSVCMSVCGCDIHIQYANSLTLHM